MQFPSHGTDQQTMQQQGASPKSYQVQLPGGLLSPRQDSDCEMEMQESPTWPPKSSSPCTSANRLNRAPSLTDTFMGVISPPGAAGALSGLQCPFGNYTAPAGKGPLAGTPSGQASGAVAAAPIAGSPVLQPKVLKAVEKPANSPSDLPGVGGNLRKVALLRALLVSGFCSCLFKRISHNNQRCQVAA